MRKTENYTETEGRVKGLKGTIVRMPPTVLFVVAIMLGLGPGALAGQAEESPSESPQVLRLTLNDALALFLKQNLDLRIRR